MLAPPLNITREELDEGLSILDDALAVADEYTVALYFFANVAVAARFAVSFSLQFAFVPVQSPDQPVNLEPAAALAFSGDGRAELERRAAGRPAVDPGRAGRDLARSGPRPS